MLFRPPWQPDDLAGLAAPEPLPEPQFEPVAAPTMFGESLDTVAAPEPDAPPLNVRDYLTRKYLDKQQALDAQEAKAMDSVQGRELAVNLAGALSGFGAGLADSRGGGGGNRAAANAHTQQLKQELRNRLLGPIAQKRAGLDKEMALEKAGIDDMRQQANLDRQMKVDAERARQNAVIEKIRLEQGDRAALAALRKMDLDERRLAESERSHRASEGLLASRLGNAIENTNTRRDEKIAKQNDDRIMAYSKAKVVDAAGEAAQAYKELEKILQGSLEQFSVDSSKQLLKDGKPVDLPGFNVPFLGRVSAHNSDARDLAATGRKIGNALLKAQAGSAVTNPEERRFAEEMSQGNFNTEREWLEAFQRAKRIMGEKLRHSAQGMLNDELLEEARRRGMVTSDDFGVSSRRGAAAEPVPAAAGGGTVKVRQPSGAILEIPKARLQEAQERAAKAGVKLEVVP